jgi:3-carboxy-cis,cis-muconate cycloisomerase
MRANLELTGGLILTEAVSTALADRVGRAEAKRAVTEASQNEEPLREALVAATELSEDEIDRLLDPGNYLGSASAFVDRALAAHEEGR